MPIIKWELLLPIIILQIILQAIAIVNLLKSTELRGPKWMWALIILGTGLIGPILYFTVARKQF